MRADPLANVSTPQPEAHERAILSGEEWCKRPAPSPGAFAPPSNGSIEVAAEKTTNSAKHPPTELVSRGTSAYDMSRGTSPVRATSLNSDDEPEPELVVPRARRASPVSSDDEEPELVVPRARRAAGC
jgi:hypothetical protein